VVDDDQNCCENTVALLEEIGIDGEWVTSGEEAVNLVAARYEKENDYFAIIIDWKMPGMDGLETTRQIRKIVGNDVTIIILSAYDYSEIAKEIIGMTGAEVVTAENGKTAVDMISSGSEGDFDLIFMDIQMPVMNGYEATAAIRTSNIPAARSVPIVAMTANAFTEDVQLARSAGMNEHISKPLDMTRLRDVMRKWL
jgi:CheY-like chemotaxis protein